MKTSEQTISSGFTRADLSRPCASQYFGPWLAEPRWLTDTAAAFNAGKLSMVDWGEEEDEPRPYDVVDGVALINISGSMSKRRSSFGGTSTLDVRRALRRAREDNAVNAILLIIDSPGGTAAGTSELADDVRDIQSSDPDDGGKPVFAHAEGYCCSAAYWVASQAGRVTATRTTGVGCIGTMTVLTDWTKYNEQLGVRLEVLAADGGEFKGLGADERITDKLRGDVLRELNELNAEFLSSVAEGRGFTSERTKELADGRTHFGPQALELGLIDEVASIDAALAFIHSQTKEAAVADPQFTETQFSKFAADNPTAVDNLDRVKQIKADAEQANAEAKSAGDAEGFARGKEEGAKAEQERFTKIAALPGASANFVVEQFKSGATPEQAKDALFEKQASENAQLREQLAKSQQKKGEGEQGQEALSLAESDGETVSDPEAKAKGEWAENKNGCRNSFLDEKTYVSFRKGELARAGH